MSRGEERVTEAERAEEEKRKEHQGTEDDVSVKRKTTSAPRAYPVVLASVTYRRVFVQKSMCKGVM